jgi:hypothetical protein
MGILSDLTPTVFRLEKHEIKARVLSISEVMNVLKSELVKLDEDLQGGELDKKATQCLNDFEFSDAMASRLIYEGCKDKTEGFDLDDAQLLVTPHHGRQVGYQIFKYVVYGVFDDNAAAADEPAEKKQEPGKPA